MEPPQKKARTISQEDVEKLGNDLKDYIDRAPTPYHLCAESIKMFSAQGFKELKESEPWGKMGTLQPGGKYFYTRNMSTLVAFCVGGKFQAGGGFHVIGAHTDSPVLKLKPRSKKSGSGYLQVNVETYGGGLWHTWFDRELSLAGCVIVAEGAGFKKRLVHVKRPILRVPSLCIHLQSAEERAAFAPNKEVHLQPIIAMVEDVLNKPTVGNGDAAGGAAEDKAKADPRHSSELLMLLAEELGCKVADIQDFDLTLCDTQPGNFWGLHNEFLSDRKSVV